MDTRFLPQPQKVHIPLYPIHGRIPAPVWGDYRAQLQSTVSKLFATDRENIFLAASGSKALYAYLKQASIGKSERLRIALPAYSCISLVQAITSAGCVPVLIDLNESLQITSKSIPFLKRESCSFIIWPSYFGPRRRDEEIAKQLQKAGISIIADEAQAFPFGIEEINDFAKRYAHIVLFSFGESKPVASMGGGGLYMPHPDKAFTDITLSTRKATSRNAGYSHLLQKAILQQIVWQYPRIAHQLGITQNRGSNVVDFLERNSLTIDFSPLTNLQAYRACHNLQQLEHAGLLKTVDPELENLRLALTAILPSAWQFLQTTNGMASIAGIALPKEKRRQIAKVLARNGIQVTWYFLPLNELPRCKSCPSEDTPITRQIAEQIMILPFQWQYSKSTKQQVTTQMVDALQTVLND